MSGFPSIALIGIHTEAEAPFRFLFESGEQIAGLVTLTRERAAGVSGAVDFEPMAREFHVPFLRTSNVNSPECEAWLRKLEPDLLLVVGWTQLLKEPLLRLPKVAALGFHASLLPYYRGRAPVNWAIINGEKETGNTMIVLEPGADEGDIVAQRRIPIGESDTCATIYRQVGQTEVDMLAEVLPIIRNGSLPRRKQDPSEVTVMPKRRPEDGLIKWAKSAYQLHNWVRALTHPYPGAFTYSPSTGRERRVWIWSAMPADLPIEGAVPGLVLKDPEGWPVVVTGCGGIRLLSVEAEGEPEVPGCHAWGRLIQPGMIFEAE